MSKNIGTNENALVLLRKAEEQTKKTQVLFKQNTNQCKSICFNMQGIGANEKSIGFIVKTHRNQQKSKGFTMKGIGTNEKKTYALL